MKYVNQLIDFIAAIPKRIWNNRNSIWYVPWREAWHTAGGSIVYACTFWNKYLNVAGFVIMMALVVYGEIRDVRKKEPIFKSILDVIFWALGFGVPFCLK